MHVLWIATALCSDLNGLPGETVEDKTLAEVLEMAAVVVEGPVVEERTEIWMGPVNSQPLRIWRVRVEQYLTGYVESGYVDVVMDGEFTPTVLSNTRVLAMLNLRTLYWPTYELGRKGQYGDVPAYEDLMVPVVHGALYYTTKSVRNGEEYDTWGSVSALSPWFPTDREERKALPWHDVISTVEAAALQCESCGASVPGALVGGEQ